jgi:hypothetical protein
MPCQDPTTPLPAAYPRHMSYDSPNDQYSATKYVEERVQHSYTLSPTTPETPLPRAYTRQLSYGLSKSQYNDPNVYMEEYDSNGSAKSPSTEVDSLDKNDKEEDEKEFSTGKRKKSVLIFLRDSRIYVRVLAVLIMIISLSLVLTAVISFAKAQKKAGHPLDNVPKPAAITDHPCVVFSGVAAMNLVFSISILFLSFMSSKVWLVLFKVSDTILTFIQFRKSNEAINAAFTIISAVGFATSMGACFFLNKQTSLQNDLWKWSCGNHKKGIVSDAIDFNLICNVVSYSWKFGLVQASLELLTFLISITAFALLKYSYLVRYGRLGKIF